MTTEMIYIHAISCYLCLGAGILLGRYWDTEEIQVYPYPYDPWRERKEVIK